LLPPAKQQKLAGMSLHFLFQRCSNIHITAFIVIIPFIHNMLTGTITILVLLHYFWKFKSCYDIGYYPQNLGNSLRINKHLCSRGTALRKSYLAFLNFLSHIPLSWNTIFLSLDKTMFITNNFPKYCVIPRIFDPQFHIHPCVGVVIIICTVTHWRGDMCVLSLWIYNIYSNV
jgi:hypothetical protein